MVSILEMENSGIIHMLKNTRTEGTTVTCYSIPSMIAHSCVPVHALPPHSDLSCMYKLFARVDDGLSCMIKYLSAHLRETGKSVVSEEPGMENSPGRNATVFIQNLLDVRDQYSMFLEKSFSGDSMFKHSIGQVLFCTLY